MNEKIKTEMECPKCFYKWQTKSTHIFVSCPSCLNKVRNEMRNKEMQK
jgi:hypothetical protein